MHRLKFLEYQQALNWVSYLWFWCWERRKGVRSTIFQYAALVSLSSWLMQVLTTRCKTWQLFFDSSFLSACRFHLYHVTMLTKDAHEMFVPFQMHTTMLHKAQELVSKIRIVSGMYCNERRNTALWAPVHKTEALTHRQMRALTVLHL